MPMFTLAKGWKLRSPQMALGMTGGIQAQKGDSDVFN